MSRNVVALFASTVATLLLASTVMAAPTNPQHNHSTVRKMFNDANLLASRGDYAKAISMYSSLAKFDVEDPDLYFNLATTLSKSGDYPQAILYYEKALRLRPTDSNISSNLKQVEQVLEKQRATVEGTATIHRRHAIAEAIFHRFPLNALAYTLLISNLLFFIGLGWAWVTNRRTTGILPLVLVSATALGFSAIGLAFGTGVFRDGRRAVVIADQVVLREGPDPRARVRGKVRGGDRGEIIGPTDHEFVHLRIHGGLEGWALHKQVGAIDPATRHDRVR